MVKEPHKPGGKFGIDTTNAQDMAIRDLVRHCGGLNNLITIDGKGAAHIPMTGLTAMPNIRENDQQDGIKWLSPDLEAARELHGGGGIMLWLKRDLFDPNEQSFEDVHPALEEIGYQCSKALCQKHKMDIRFVFFSEKEIEHPGNKTPFGMLLLTGPKDVARLQGEVFKDIQAQRRAIRSQVQYEGTLDKTIKPTKRTDRDI